MVPKVVVIHYRFDCTLQSIKKVCFTGFARKLEIIEHSAFLSVKLLDESLEMKVFRSELNKDDKSLVNDRSSH